MSEEQQIIKVSINKVSVFRVKDYYDFFYNLITSQGFDVLEDNFTHSDKETSFEWTCLRWVDDYVQYKLWLKSTIKGLQKVTVKKEGLSEPMNKGEVSITIKGKIVTDWQKRWATTPLLKFLKGVFDKYLFKPTFESRKSDLIQKVKLMENELKSYFELPRFM